MAFSVQMPALGESVTEGTVTRWLKQEGDQVEVDEPLLEVSTDKVDTEIPSPAAGVLSKIVVAEDQTVEIGAELAVISESGDGRGGSAARSEPAPGTVHRAEGPGRGGAELDGAALDGAELDGAELDGAEESGAGRNGTDGGRTSAPARDWPAEAGQPASGAPSTGQPEEPARRPAAGAGSGGPDTVVTMPALGESVTEGTVTRWLKRVGDTVEADEPLLEVSTDKVDTEIPSPVAGTVLEITVDEDQTVEVGAQLARIGDAKAQPAQAPPATAPEPAASAQASGAGAQPGGASAQASGANAQPRVSAWSPPGAVDADQPPPRPALTPREPAQARTDPPRLAEPLAGNGNGGTQRAAALQPAAEADGQPGAAPYVTPLVRKLAAEHNVDLAGLRGTGVGGRIRKQDVLAAAEAAKAVVQPPATPQPGPAASAAQPAGTGARADAAAGQLRGRTEKMSRLRQVIAKRMVESLQTSAQLTTVLEVDVTRIARLRDRAKRDFEAREGVKLSFLPFFAKTAVEALKQHPKLNASINSETSEVTYHSAEHLGMAVDTERGLLVPVIHDAGDLNIAGLARRIADLAERTRNNKVTPDELSGGTFTLTNTGSRGALFDTPIINQPQVAILGTGAVVKRPVVLPGDAGDTIAIRSMMYLALSYDHRLVDGADAARFLTTVKERLEAGSFEPDL